jgi:hypothetical protein
MDRILFREVRWHILGPVRIRSWLDTRLHLGNCHWVFLLGVNNSGTTLLSRVLEKHPEISAMRVEGQNVTSAYLHPSRLGAARVWSECEDTLRWTERSDPSPALRALYDWSYYITPNRFVLEKSPTNMLRSRWLQAHFQPASFIAIVRHPFAVCEGIRRRSTDSLSRAARHWVRAHEIFQEDSPRLNRLMWIRYEDLCFAPLDWMRRVERFLGATSAFGSQHENAVFDVHNIDDAQKQITNLNAASFEQLTEADKDLVEDIAGPLMSRFGYDRLGVGPLPQTGVDQLI